MGRRRGRAFLDRFPNADVDLAARLVHLEYQAARNPERVRAFLMHYQDRVLYGSDDAYGPGDSDPQGRGRCACRLARGLAVPGDLGLDALG